MCHNTRPLIRLFHVLAVSSLLATAASAGIVDEFRGTGQTDQPKNDCKLARSWRIMVVIPEWHIRRRIPDPAAETAMTRELLKAEFRVMDRDLAAKYRYNERVVAALEAGDIPTIKKVFRDAKADILVVGEAFSQGVGTVGNLVSCRARCEIKAVRRDSGEIIAAVGKQAGGLDLSEEMAAKTALDSAGTSAAKELMDRLCKLSDSSSVYTEVIITGLKSASVLAEIETELKALPGVKDVQRDEFDEGIATLELLIDKSLASEVQSSLEKVKSHKLDVIKSTKNSITVLVSD